MISILKRDVLNAAKIVCTVGLLLTGYMDGINKRMIDLTSSCCDCDYIPKVDGSGQIFSDFDGLIVARSKCTNGVESVAISKR